jgi:hypothetical protein
MDYTIKNLVWKILCWNIRGLNDDAKQLALYNKIVECGCAIACIQETKKQDFDFSFIKKCCPKQFDNFSFAPSVGASGGILVVWKSSVFRGQLIDTQRFGIIIEFSSTHNMQKWTLVVVYGPCQGELRDLFIQWLNDLQIPDGELWLFMGDFNFIRSPTNRNNPGGNVADMFTFNQLIDHLGLLDIPIKKDVPSPGKICNTTLCLNNWTGFSLALPGLLLFLTLWSLSCQNQPQTMHLVLLVLIQLSPRLSYFDLRTSGFINKVSLIVSRRSGVDLCKTCLLLLLLSEN